MVHKKSDSPNASKAKITDTRKESARKSSSIRPPLERLNDLKNRAADPESEK
jgi:hypothetical protein